MIKTHQKAVHTNGYRINYQHTNTAHRDSSSHSNSGSDNHNNASTSGWTMSCGWYARHTDYGYSNHSNSNSHSNTAAVNTTKETSRTPTNEVNKSPSVTGSTFANSRYYNSKSIKIDLSSLSYSDVENNTRQSFRIYYQYSSSQNGTYGNWQLLSEQTATSYKWVATSLTAGWYKIGVTVYDGNSWSAAPSGSGWTATHEQRFTAGSVTASNGGTGYTDVVEDNTTYDTTYAAVSSPIRIYHYSSPANDSSSSTNWNKDYYTKGNIDQVQTETNKVLTAMGQTNITFTNAPVVSQFTIITWADMQQLRSGVSTAYNLRKGSNPTLSAQTDFIENNKIIDIQNLLDLLGEGDN